jgi:hypothetical protein
MAGLLIPMGVWSKVKVKKRLKTQKQKLKIQQAALLI